MRLSHLPLRLATGALILNSGLDKRGLDADSAAGLQGMASVAVPRLGQLPPEQFGRALSAGEMALGAALLAPFVSPLVAGAALTAFSAGMLKMYLTMPGMTREDGIRPTPDGMPLAKDAIMFAAGLTLVVDGLVDDARGAARSTRRAARKRARAVKQALPTR